MTRAATPQHLGRRPRTVLAGSAALVLAAVGAVAGCGGDPAPKPSSTSGLEVVLDGCRISLASVPAGAHTVRVVGQGRATVSDAQGNVVLTAPGGEEEPADLALTKGTYDVTCEPEGGRLGEARLKVS